MSGTFTNPMTGNAATIIYYTTLPASAPRCECGAPATNDVRDSAGRLLKRTCLPCGERIERDSYIAQAPRWIEAAFRSVAKPQRARLYKQLAIVFHPDQGGDERLMVALNAVRERMP